MKFTLGILGSLLGTIVFAFRVPDGTVVDWVFGAVMILAGTYFLGQTIGRIVGWVSGVAFICACLVFTLGFWFAPDSLFQASIKAIALFIIGNVGGMVGWHIYVSNALDNE